MKSRKNAPELGKFVKDTNIVDAEFGELKIDKEKRSLLCPGDVRLSMGKYYTNEEFEERKKRVLGKSLP